MDKHKAELAVAMDVTEDHVLGGRVRLRQPARGYRAGMDAALLAAACDASPGQRLMEAGCGVGAALLAAAERRPGVSVVGLERDPAMAGLARDNVALNGLGDRAAILEGDVARGFRAVALDRFDAVMSNPPFFDDPRSLRAPAEAKTGAWIADDGLAAWTAFLLQAARDGGTVTVIHRADRLADLLSQLSAKAGSFQVLPVQPFADAPAKRVMVRAVRGGRAPLAILPPLVLHDRQTGRHTAAVDALMRGETQLTWL